MLSGSNTSSYSEKRVKPLLCLRVSLPMSTLPPCPAKSVGPETPSMVTACFSTLCCAGVVRALELVATMVVVVVTSRDGKPDMTAAILVAGGMAATTRIALRLQHLHGMHALMPGNELKVYSKPSKKPTLA